ncbi:MAG: ABC transporter permease [Bryobacteraceae bacterium]
MHRALLIARRDYLATIRTKAFLIGLVVAPILFGGGFLGIALLKSQPDIKERRVAILDRTGQVATAVIAAIQEQNAKDLFEKGTHKQVMPRYVFETPAAESDLKLQRLRLSDRVRSQQLFAFIEIGTQALHPTPDKVASRVDLFTNSAGIDDTRRWLVDPLNEGIRRVRLTQLGVDPSHFKDVSAYVPLERMSLVARDAKTGAIQAARKKGEMDDFGIPFSLMLLLGMIVMVGSAPMLSAVTEDKAQRIVEMLLGMATPFELMMGKVIAAVGVSLTSSAFYILGGTLALQGMGMAGLVPFSLFPWFYAYLVADVTMLCALAAALGAACSSPQEAQQLAVLLFAPVMIPYFFFMVVMQQPGGAFATTMSLVPFFTPMLMLLRQAMPGGVPTWQPWVGLAGVTVCTITMVWMAARVFRVAILLQGKAPKAADLVRWAIRG